MDDYRFLGAKETGNVRGVLLIDTVEGLGEIQMG